MCYQYIFCAISSLMKNWYLNYLMILKIMYITYKSSLSISYNLYQWCAEQLFFEETASGKIRVGGRVGF